jgi:hypothetical protein
MKMTVSRDVVPCSLVEFTDVSEVLAASINRTMTHRPDGGILHGATSQKKRSS